MYRYIRSSMLNLAHDFTQTPGGGFERKIIDESGQTLTLQISEWANGWDWLLKDSDNYLISDSDGITFTTAQEALDDFEDWTVYNQ